MQQSVIELTKLNCKYCNNSNTYNSNCKCNESIINKLSLDISNSWFISDSVKNFLEEEIKKNNDNAFKADLSKKIKQYTYDEFAFKLQFGIASTFGYLSMAFGAAALIIGTFGSYFVTISALLCVASMSSTALYCIVIDRYDDINTRENKIKAEINCLSKNKRVNN